MSGVQSTSAQRKNYGPNCKDQTFKGAQEAWDAHQTVMRHYNYKLRDADTGSRNCRPITGGTAYSLHAFFLNCYIVLWNLGKKLKASLALDSNWQTNSYGPTLVTDRPRAMCDDIEDIRTNSGAQVFRWGGYYTGNKDAMHDEVVCTPADLATGVNWSTVRGHSSQQPTPIPIPEEDQDMPVVQIQCAPGRTEWPEIKPHVFKTNGLRTGTEWVCNVGHSRALHDLLKVTTNDVDDIIYVSPNFLLELIPDDFYVWSGMPKPTKKTHPNLNSPFLPAG